MLRPAIHMALADSDSVQLPAGMNPLTPSKILVQTGPRFKDIACTGSVTIEVYLLPPGEYFCKLAVITN